MKATIDIPDHLYRRVKAKSAMERHTVREVAISLFQDWADGSIQLSPAAKTQPEPEGKAVIPAWYGSLKAYAARAKGGSDMEAVRKSIGKGLARERGA